MTESHVERMLLSKQTGININSMNNGVDNNTNVNVLINDASSEILKKKGRGYPKKSSDSNRVFMLGYCQQKKIQLKFIILSKTINLFLT